MKTSIVNHAIELFHRHGVRNVTMDDIARQTGISKRTLYEYFANKEAVIVECVNQRVRQEDLLNNRHLGLLDLLLEYLDRVGRLNRSVNSRCVSDIRKYHYPVYEYIVTRIELFATKFSDTLGESVARGYIRDDVSPDFVYKYLLRHLSRLFHDNESNSGEYVDFMSRSVLVFARGIATSKGQAHIDNELKKRISE